MPLPGLAVACILLAAFGAGAQERGAVIAYIESFSGDSTDYGIQRDSGVVLEVRLRTQLRQGDQVEIRRDGETAVIRFTDGSQEDLGPAAGWYGPYAERGSEASVLSNLLATVASTVADFRSRPVQTVATAARGNGGPIVMGPLFTEYPLALAAGKRSLIFRWGGGDAPYGVRITRVDGGDMLVDVDGMERQQFRSEALDLIPGDYDVEVTSVDSSFGFRFQVLEPSDLPEPIATADMSAAAGRYLNAYALAVADDNDFAYEAYQRLATLADQGYAPAGLLMIELEEGEARYWESPTGTGGTENSSGENASSSFQSTTPGETRSADLTAERLFELAVEARDSGELESAEALLTEYIANVPDDARAYWLRGKTRVRRSEDHEGAVADFETVNRLVPRFSDAWGSRGWYLILLNRIDEARPVCEKAHELAPREFAYAVNLGHTYLLQGDQDTARRLYLKSLPLIEDEETLSQGPLADFDLFIERGWMVDASKEEKQWFVQAWDDQQEAAEKAASAEALHGEAQSFYDAGQYAEAEPLFREALALRREALPAESLWIANNLYSLASVLVKTESDAEAESMYREALAIYRKKLPAAHWRITETLNQLAGLLRQNGRNEEAEPLYREALTLRRGALPPGHRDLAPLVNNLGLLLKYTGRYGEAEPLLREGLAINRQVLPAGHPDIAISLNHLATLLEDTGRYSEAEPLYREALVIRRKALAAGDRNIAESLNNLAGVLRETGRDEEAEPLYREALAIHREALPPRHRNIAVNIGNLGTLLTELGRYDEAEPLAREGLSMSRQAMRPGHPDIASGLSNVATLLMVTARNDEADPLLREALVIASQTGQPQLLWFIQNRLTILYGEQNRPEVAILFGKQAVNTLQSIRRGLQTLDLDAQQAYLRSKEFDYRYLADLLISEGRLVEAEQVLAMLKEQEYFDFVRRDTNDDIRTTQAGYTSWESEWIAAYEAVAQNAAAMGEELGTLEGEAPSGLTDTQQARRDELQDRLDAAAIAYDEYLDRLLASVDEAGGKRAREVGAQNLGESIALQETLLAMGEGTVLVQYVIMDERLHVLLTTPYTQLARQSMIASVELNKLTAVLRADLQNPISDVTEAARALHAHLLAPIAADLEKAGAETLMVSLDGALRYVPVAALYDGERYVAERYRTVVFTPATRDKLGRRGSRSRKVAGMGLTKAHPGFDALPAVAVELDGIVRQTDRADEQGVMPGEVLLDDAFTPHALQGVLDQSYPLLHVASHFSFNPGTEADSFLLLGDGTRLSLADLRSRRYRFRDVDLLTLSACNTAVGQGAQGTEVEGFGVLAQRQGAAGVMATLWPVADASTGRFMQAFYRLLAEQPQLNKAEAMQQVQLEFLSADIVPLADAAVARGETVSDWSNAAAAKPTQTEALDWSHPYYWAPFILMGNWL